MKRNLPSLMERILLARISPYRTVLLMPRVKLMPEHDVEVAPFAGASGVCAHEQHTAGPDREGVSLLLAGVVAVSVVVVCASGSPAWDAGPVSELAARQADHLAAGGIA